MTKTVSENVSRRSVAKGLAWAVPAVSVGAAAPAMAASPTGNITGITGFQAVVSDAASSCPSQMDGTVTPSSNNPAPIITVETTTAIGAKTGDTAMITVRLNSIVDTSGTGAGSRITFVPGTYTATSSNGVATATSTCAATNAQGACTAITLTWKLTGVGTTADNNQLVPFRVGLMDSTTIPASKLTSTGFYGEAYGGGPAGTSAGQEATFNGGTYSGAYSCPA